jgi:spore germination protein Q
MVYVKGGHFVSNQFNGVYPNFPRVTQPHLTPAQQATQLGQGTGFMQPSGGYLPPGQAQPGQPMQPMQPGQLATAAPSPAAFLEQSYIENILRANRGKIATIYMTFTGQTQEQVFVGHIIGAGRDHIALRDVNSNKTYLLLQIYLDYITFDEQITYPFPT